MPTFTYIASEKNGAIVEGELEAKDQSLVITHLENHGRFPISIKEKKKNKKLVLALTGTNISLLDKIILTRNLALMVRSGIGIADAVSILEDDAERAVLRKVLGQTKADLEKGLQLSDALARFPRHFSPILINLLKAGEASGSLEGSLLQISNQLKKEQDLKKKVRSAMAYPAILLSLALGVVTLLVMFVFPRVSAIFSQSHVELPLITRVLLGASDFLVNQWLAAAILGGLGIGTLVAARRSAAARNMVRAITKRVPVAGILMQKVTLTRFTTTMHSLLKAGVPVIRALEISAQSLGDAAYEKAVLEMTKNEISRGVSLGMALKRRPALFPRLVASMVTVGEKSGNLEQMLENLSTFYEEEVDNALRNLIAILEPLLLLGIGLIIGALALSIIMPIYQMIGAVR